MKRGVRGAPHALRPTVLPWYVPVLLDSYGTGSSLVVARETPSTAQSSYRYVPSYVPNSCAVAKKQQLICTLVGKEELQKGSLDHPIAY